MGATPSEGDWEKLESLNKALSLRRFQTKAGTPRRSIVLMNEREGRVT